MIKRRQLAAPLRLAFVACNKNAARWRDDASYLYRCENIAEALKQQGHTVWQGHVTRLPWLQRWDVVVFHRPRATWHVRAALHWLRHRRVTVVADVDDLIFDAGMAEFSPGVVNGLVTLERTVRLFRAHHDAFARFDRIVVSTAPLAEHVRRMVPRAAVHIAPNAVHWRWRDLPRPAVTTTQAIAYLPGTRSHDRDFATIAPVLTRILGRHPQATLHVTGPLRFSLDVLPGQVVHQPKVPFDRFHECFKGVRVNLAPLSDSPFNRCKSAIKVLEAAWWGVPTVVSPLADAERLADAGAHIAPTEEAFEETLERLLADDTSYLRAVDGLRERILHSGDVYRVASDWLQFVMHGRDSRLDAGSRAP
ncbi:glycosyltransferase family protein [Cupriavidus oxalaticus]|uniref:Glycosyltransferase family 1 protein n=1 Tax=Cupriavidus oxalaticus TaxID=96344 RepID=A0A4P7L9U3_9BURK|nr:glycosyltransferase [Cupriavidus oxalaticus]QBY49683.1 glycosyltransferase family 1 protein [Cupriavidus oxalaticus]